MSRLDALVPNTRFLARWTDSALLGGNVFLAGMLLDQPAAQAAGISMAALSPVIAHLMRMGHRAPEKRRPAEEEVLTRADHHHFLATYELARARADELHPGGNALLGAVPTQNVHYRAMLDRMQSKLRNSLGPVLLLGPTGTGKSELARAIHEVRKAAGLLTGDFVEVTCTEIKNEAHLTSLFGNVKGAYTGAENPRGGLLWMARGGTLFFDEIGELSPEQQGILLRLMAQKRYRPMGQDAEVTTDATFVFATLRDPRAMVEEGLFRFDFLQRISTFTFTLPGLAERPEDFDALVDFHVEVVERAYGVEVDFDADARQAYLGLCRSPTATWPGNIRALASSIERMAANDARRIDMAEVEAEAAVLMQEWTWRPKVGAGLGGAGAVAVPPVVTTPVDLAARDEAEEAELPPSVRGKLKRPQRAEALVYVRACRAHPNVGDAAEAVWDDEPETSRKLKAERLRRALLGFGLTYETARER